MIAVFLLGSDRWSRIVPRTGQTGEPGGTIDLLRPAGGLAEVGAFGAPWIVIIPIGIALTASIAASVGRTVLDPDRSFRDWFRRRPTRSTRRERIEGVAGGLAGPVVFFLLSFAADYDPLVSGSVHGPGPSVTQIRTDGVTIPEVEGNLTPDDWNFSSDRFVYRLSAGDTFTYIASVRNSGPVAVRLLGLTAPVAGALTTDAPLGMFLLRDPTVLSLEPQHLIEFLPMDLEPGSESPSSSPRRPVPVPIPRVRYGARRPRTRSPSRLANSFSFMNSSVGVTPSRYGRPSKSRSRVSSPANSRVRGGVPGPRTTWPRGHRSRAGPGRRKLWPALCLGRRLRGSGPGG